MIEHVKCTLKPSKIHGIGVFALFDIKKGEKLYCYEEPQWRDNLPKNPVLRAIAIKRSVVTLEGASYQWPEVMFICFMNHQDEPNYDKDTDLALRDIKRGEEITEDYGRFKEICLSI